MCTLAFTHSHSTLRPNYVKVEVEDRGSATNTNEVLVRSTFSVVIFSCICNVTFSTLCKGFMCRSSEVLNVKATSEKIGSALVYVYTLLFSVNESRCLLKSLTDKFLIFMLALFAKKKYKKTHMYLAKDTLIYGGIVQDT